MERLNQRSSEPCPSTLRLIRASSLKTWKKSAESLYWRIKFDFQPILGLGFANNTPVLMFREMTVLGFESLNSPGVWWWERSEERFSEPLGILSVLPALGALRSQTYRLLFDLYLLSNFESINKGPCLVHKPLSSLSEKIHYYYTFIPRISDHESENFCQIRLPIPKYTGLVIILDFFEWIEMLEKFQFSKKTITHGPASPQSLSPDSECTGSLWPTSASQVSA